MLIVGLGGGCCDGSHLVDVYGQVAGGDGIERRRNGRVYG